MNTENYRFYPANKSDKHRGQIKLTTRYYICIIDVPSFIEGNRTFTSESGEEINISKESAEKIIKLLKRNKINIDK